MSANPFDTLGTARDLEAAGFERAQAEASANLFRVGRTVPWTFPSSATGHEKQSPA